MNNLPLTIIGNLTGDPELRFTPSGAAVANFTIAHTPRKFDRQSNEWKDGETTFMNCSVWREQAENVAESFKRGDRVIAYGNLTSRSYETKAGEKRTIMELNVEEVGASVLKASVTVAKKTAARSGGQGGWGAPSAGKADDPWASPAKEGTVHQPPAGGWGAPTHDEPPF